MNEVTVKKAKEMAQVLPSAAGLTANLEADYKRFDFSGRDDYKDCLKAQNRHALGIVAELKILAAQTKALADFLEAETTRPIT